MSRLTNLLGHIFNAAYGPGHSAFSVTPDTGEALIQNGDAVVLRALYVGTGGTVSGKVATHNDDPATVVFENVPSGTVLNVAFVEIDEDTTATDLVGLL